MEIDLVNLCIAVFFSSNILCACLPGAVHLTLTIHMGNIASNARTKTINHDQIPFHIHSVSVSVIDSSEYYKSFFAESYHVCSINVRKFFECVNDFSLSIHICLSNDSLLSYVD